MTHYLRTPWITRAVQGSGSTPTNPAAQILAFDDTPECPHTTHQVVRISDRAVWVYAVFTSVAITAFEDNDADGQPFHSLRGGLINLKE
jgi:hypothetical protein